MHTTVYLAFATARTRERGGPPALFDLLMVNPKEAAALEQLSAQTHAELQPLVDHLSALPSPGRTPFQGSALQTALLELHTTERSNWEALEAVIIATEALAFKCSLLVARRGVAKDTLLLLLLFEVDGTPMFAGMDKSATPIFALAFAAQTGEDGVTDLRLRRVSDVQKSETWSPPPGWHSFRWLAGGWLPAAAWTEQAVNGTWFLAANDEAAFDPAQGTDADMYESEEGEPTETQGKKRRRRRRRKEKKDNGEE